MTDLVCFLFKYQGVAMAISTTAFGVYFYLMSKMHSTTSLSLLMLDVQSTAGEEPHADLAWLALASMAVFITGEIVGHTHVTFKCSLRVQIIPNLQ